MFTSETDIGSNWPKANISPWLISTRARKKHECENNNSRISEETGKRGGRTLDFSVIARMQVFFTSPSRVQLAKLFCWRTLNRKIQGIADAVDSFEESVLRGFGNVRERDLENVQILKPRADPKMKYFNHIPMQRVEEIPDARFEIGTGDIQVKCVCVSNVIVLELVSRKEEILGLTNEGLMVVIEVLELERCGSEDAVELDLGNLLSMSTDHRS